MKNKQVKEKKIFRNCKAKLGWQGTLICCWKLCCSTCSKCHGFFDPLLKRVFGEPSGASTGCFFFQLLVRLVGDVPTASRTLSRVGFVFLGFGSFDAHNTAASL